jgi:hypothetical protein
MPVARYFMIVGGALLTLLFLIDAYSPRAVVTDNTTPSIDRSVVRIHSDQKLPERVVYDTSLPTIVPPAPKVQVAAAPQPPVAVDPTAQAPVRDSFAQFVPVNAKKPEPQVQRKRRIAKVRANPPMRFAQQQFAQQQHFGFFGSTW